jgi:sugar phosphate isomerase/epimerase
MYSNLNAGALVGGVDFEQSVQLAIDNGFGGVSPDIGYLASLSDSDLTALRARLADHNLQWGAPGLGVDPGGDDETVATQLADLRKQAAVLENAGVDRSVRYLWPTSDNLTYDQNLELHASRIAQIAGILSEHGIRLGLEYVGPKTLWSTGKYPFVRTLAQTRELIAATGASNVGICLDTFHWFTAGESADDLRTLTDADVVSADVNDAVTGVPADEQLDQQRELPGRTGVINVAAFIQALRDIGYSGPVQAEPFNAALRALAPTQAIAETAESLKAALG